MLRITAPVHSVEDKAEWIHPLDPAIDNDRVARDRKVIGTDVDHPILTPYYSCSTRYSLTARATLPEALRTPDGPETASVLDYITPGKRPTRFEIRPVADSRDWILCINDPASEFEFARLGLVAIHDAAGDDGKPTKIDPPRDPDGNVARAWLSALDGDTTRRLGLAVRQLSRNEVVFAEGKP